MSFIVSTLKSISSMIPFKRNVTPKSDTFDVSDDDTEEMSMKIIPMDVASDSEGIVPMDVDSVDSFDSDEFDIDDVKGDPDWTP